MNVADSIRMKSHQPRTRCISRHRIVRQHNVSQSASGAVERPVAFHGYDAVRYHEMDGNGWLPGTVRSHAGNQVNLVGQWTAATLPQCWLLGAVVILVCRAVQILMSRRASDFDDLMGKRKAFARLWRWVMAVGCVQICALYLDWVTKVQ